MDWVAIGAIGTLAMAVAVFFNIRKTEKYRRRDKYIRDIDDIVIWAEFVTRFLDDATQQRHTDPLSIYSAYAPVNSKFLTVFNLAKQLRNEDLVRLVNLTYIEAEKFKQSLIDTIFVQNEQDNINKLKSSHIALKTLKDTVATLFEKAISIREEYL